MILVLYINEKKQWTKNRALMDTTWICFHSEKEHGRSALFAIFQVARTTLKNLIPYTCVIEFLNQTLVPGTVKGLWNVPEDKPNFFAGVQGLAEGIVCLLSGVSYNRVTILNWRDNVWLRFSYKVVKGRPPRFCRYRVRFLLVRQFCCVNLLSLTNKKNSFVFCVTWIFANGRQSLRVLLCEKDVSFSSFRFNKVVSQRGSLGRDVICRFGIYWDESVNNADAGFWV